MKEKNESKSSDQKKFKRQFLKKRNGIFQKRVYRLPHIFRLEENLNEHEMNEMDKHELRNELSNQKLTNEASLFRVDIDGKLVHTILPLKDIIALDKYSKFVVEHYDGEFVVITEA